MDSSLLIIIPVSAVIVTLLSYAIAQRMFPLLGLLDFPERYGLSRPRLPYPTGIIAVLVFLIMFLFLDGSLQATGVAVAVCILAVYSFIDDRTPLPSWMRLTVQVLIAILIFATGSRIYTLTNPLDQIPGFPALIKLDTFDIQTIGFGPLPFWSGVFTVLWLGLTMNALNWFDGIPGQVSALSFIAFLTIGFLSVSDRVNQPELALIAFTLAGIALGGLFFDFPPARVLMGDTGAMFFGLMLGVLTIYAGGKVATAFLVLGVPLIDSAIVIFRRIASGKSPMKGSHTGEHLHHRLLAKGWNPRQIIGLTALLGTFFGVTALFLDTIGKFIAGLALLAVMIGLSLYSSPSTKS